MGQVWIDCRVTGHDPAAGQIDRQGPATLAADQPAVLEQVVDPQAADGDTGGNNAVIDPQRLQRSIERGVEPRAVKRGPGTEQGGVAAMNGHPHM